MFKNLLRPHWNTPEQLTPEAIGHWYDDDDLSLRKALIIQRVLFYHYEGQKAPFIVENGLKPIYAKDTIDVEQGDDFQQYINSAGETLKGDDLVGFEIYTGVDQFQFIELPDIHYKN